MRPIKDLKAKVWLTVFYGGVLAIAWLLGMDCLFQTFLHIPCPGCGMSRAVFSLCRLDITGALLFHPMIWSVPVLYLYFLYDGRLFRRKTVDRTVLLLIAAGFAANWVRQLF